MAFSDAEQLVRMFGAGSILCVGGSDGALAAELRQRGALVERAASLADASRLSIGAAVRFDCIVAEAGAMLDGAALADGFQALRRLAPRWVVVRFSEHRQLIRKSREAGLRAAWENAAVASGYRRAPQAVAVERYATECQDPGVPLLLEFERIPDAALAAFPPASAPAGSALRMDMTREAGARADAHMVRYALAATLVRAGDTVLDWACGAGYGSAILAAQSAGARFIGVDTGPASVAYASASFQEQYGIEYVTAGAAGLSFLADDSIDLLVSFGTLEYLQDYSLFLDEAARVLKPNGRIVASAPNRWVDQGGKAADPSHLHAFDYATFRDALAARFLIEERWEQNAPGGVKLQHAPRELNKLALDSPDIDAEWLILVASSDPLAKRSARAYQNTEFPAHAAPPGCWVVEFGSHYDNPWLYRTMVHMGDRLRDREALTVLAARALGELPLASADFGAALAVLGYALLEQPEGAQVEDVFNLADAYLAQDIPNPHAMRWQISVAYLAGRLAMARGERALAVAYLSPVAQADFMVFSPLLATKSIAASFQLGAMALAEGDRERAAGHFADGVATCRKALKADDVNAIGDPAAPYPFGFTELAEVADMGAQCAAALRFLPLHGRSPGLFWRQVDTRRFGLVSWALALARENRELRNRLAG